MAGSIIVVSALTNCALLHSVYDLMATQMNMKCSLIQELTNLNETITLQKQPKTFEQKLKMKLITV